MNSGELIIVCVSCITKVVKCDVAYLVAKFVVFASQRLAGQRTCRVRGRHILREGIKNLLSFMIICCVNVDIVHNAMRRHQYRYSSSRSSGIIQTDILPLA